MSGGVNYGGGGGSGTVTSVDATVPSVLSVSGGPITTSGTLAISYSGTALPVLNGGTGQTTANASFNALAPSQTANSGKYLTTDGSNTSWGTVSSSPGGSTTQFQYNNAGAFGGTAYLTYDNSTGVIAFSPTGTYTGTAVFYENLSGMTLYNTAKQLNAGTLSTSGGTKHLDWVTAASPASMGNAVIMRRTDIAGGSTNNGAYIAANYVDANATHSGKTLGGLYDSGSNGVYAYKGLESAGSSGGAQGLAVASHNSNYVIGGNFAGIYPVGSSPQSYGVRAYATGENSAQQVGGYFRVYTVQDATNEAANAGVSAGIVVSNGDTTHDIVNFRDNTTERFVVEDGGTVDISGIAAGTPNLRITATSDTPTVTWGAAAGNEASTTPAGYLEISVGGNARYIPFWA